MLSTGIERVVHEFRLEVSNVQATSANVSWSVPLDLLACLGLNEFEIVVKHACVDNPAQFCTNNNFTLAVTPT